MLSHIQLFVTPWTVTHQVPLSMGFPRQEYWRELPFPTPGYLPDRGVEPESLVSLASLALADGFFTYFTTWEAVPILSISAVPLTYSILKLHNSPHTYS